MARTIPALFENHDEASRAVQDLVSHGFARDDNSVMARDDIKRDGRSGLARGAGIGAAAGGIGGLVIGVSTLIAVPAIAFAISVPALISTLLGAGVGAATGGLLGALTKLGIPKEQAHYYSEGIRRGGVLVAVETPENRTEEARTILSRHNPIELSTRAEELHQSGWTRFEPYTEPSHMPEAARAAGAASAAGASQVSHMTATAVAQRDKVGQEAAIADEVTSRTDLKKIFLEMRHDVEEAKSRPALTELYKRAGYLITLTHTPAWEEKFGKEVTAIRKVAEEEFATTARKINHRAAQIGTEADYDETWGGGV